MFWSLFKILVFVAIVAAIGFGASILADWDADIRIIFAGVELTIAPLTMIAAVLLLIPITWLVLAFIGLLVAIVRFAVGDETALTRFFDKSRERRGLESFAEGMIALASGEPRVALSKAYRAERNLGKPELTGILSAQAAEEAGDAEKSLAAYKKLLENEKTKFVGLRGVLKLKLAEGDTETALKLAEKAFALKPKQMEIQDSLLNLQTKAQDWAGARATLSAKMKSRTLPRNVYSRRDAILSLADAKQKIAGGDAKAGQAAVLAANRAISDFVPAAVLAANIQTEAGAKRAATRIIRKAWDSAPHPDLAAAFAAIEPNETPEQRMRRFESLVSKNPSDPEAKMVLAEVAIAAGDFSRARTAMGDLAENLPSVRSLAIMAAIERGQGAEGRVVRGWLARALSATRGPAWICDACGQHYPEWIPVCESCNGLDMISWKETNDNAHAHPSTIGVLPLIVAAPNDQSDHLGDVHQASEAEDLRLDEKIDKD